MGERASTSLLPRSALRRLKRSPVRRDRELVAGPLRKALDASVVVAIRVGKPRNAVVELPLPMVTLPLTAAVRIPALLSPITLILPVVDSEPVSALSTATPADWLPSTVIAPLLTMLPV